MKAEKIEFSEDGLIIDGKKYGPCITKVEIESIYKIKIYIHKSIALKNFDEVAGRKVFKDYNNPYNLMQYENIRIVEE